MVALKMTLESRENVNMDMDVEKDRGSSSEEEGQLTDQELSPQRLDGLDGLDGPDSGRHTRYDTLHLRGTRAMTTNDIFAYFRAGPPLFVEWIDENSCNAGWKDDLSAARALYERSESVETATSVSSLPAPVPPGKWRYGNPHAKSDAIFIRFATKSDRKPRKSEIVEVLAKKFVDGDAGVVSESLKSKIRSSNADRAASRNPWGDLCQTWGIDDFQEIFSEGGKAIGTRLRRPEVPRGLEGDDLRMKLGKRAKPEVRRREVDDDDDERDGSERSEDEEWTRRSKVPRLRMHADDEEARRKPRSPARRRGRDDLRSKIEKRRPRDVPEESDGEDDDEEDRHRVNSSVRSNAMPSSVWSRLDKKSNVDSASDPEAPEDDLRGIISGKRLSGRPEFSKKDLRSKINRHNKTERSPLRIELDNDIYKP